MAIAPIDLQTLFTQMDKVGKTGLAQKEGQPLQQIMQAIQTQKKEEELLNQINETKSSGEGADKIKDRDHGNENNREETGNGKHNHNNPEEQKKNSILIDPALGNKIDISL